MSGVTVGSPTETLLCSHFPLPLLYPDFPVIESELIPGAPYPGLLERTLSSRARPCLCLRVSAYSPRIDRVPHRDTLAPVLPLTSPRVFPLYRQGVTWRS